MTLLPILYWILLILSIVGVFAPATWPHGARISSTAWVVLFIILGLRVFPISLQ